MPDLDGPADLLDHAPTPATVLTRLSQRERLALGSMSLTHFRPLPNGLRGAGPQLVALRLALRSGEDLAITDFGIEVRKLAEADRG